MREKINSDMIPCPNSLERANLMTNFAVHYATQQELKQNGGVCRKCFLTFASRNHTLDGSEEPVKISSHHQQSADLDHTGFSQSGQVESTVDFDYDQIRFNGDTREFFDNASNDVRVEAATALGLILEWVWQSGFESAQRKFAILSAGLRPELLNDESLEQIATRLGCGKAALSKAGLLFQKTFGVKFSRTRSAEARQHMAASMKGNSNRRRSAPARPPAAI